MSYSFFLMCCEVQESFPKLKSTGEYHMDISTSNIASMLHGGSLQKLNIPLAASVESLAELTTMISEICCLYE